ncbi:unnamed protein product [Penicillium salamii]|nr:unnamed protein product [Penicillium salamii]
MADIDAYSREAGKLSYLVMQQRPQLLVLNGFKELVLAKQTDQAMEVLGRNPQPTILTSNPYGLIAQFVRYCGSYPASITWSDHCMDFELKKGRNSRAGAMANHDAIEAAGHAGSRRPGGNAKNRTC